ncbi:hypothetical protein E1301_Tti013875 [Triplophysa tibetana]|uniref:Uncharacterized protein n=1 Tax=Triplophysa tibetana TaxID=1572043 RepID=A0A5A9P1I9_9TELE|nr:hypothetical protein E1301_Tti013875 [Triplophysa tibetana]
MPFNQSSIIPDLYSSFCHSVNPEGDFEIKVDFEHDTLKEIAVLEGLYLLFRELLPGLSERSSHQAKIIEDSEVFEHANICWGYLIDQGEKESSSQENYATVSLKPYPNGERLSEPVRVPGISEVFERSYVLERITDGLRIPNCD